MPYIPKVQRPALRQEMNPSKAGELNFCITELCRRYMANNAVCRYEELNSIMGAIESAKQEFYRRVVVPYEISKIESEGDIYGEPLETDIYKYKP